MIDLLKKMAVEKLTEKMFSNSLSADDTSSAAEEGSSMITNLLMDQVKSGNLGAVTSLFSNDGNATQDNDLFKTIVGSLGSVLMSKGMGADEAKSEASNIAPGLVDGLKDKFLSTKSEDSGFDLSKMGDLLGGDTGGLLGKVGGLLG